MRRLCYWRRRSWYGGGGKGRIHRTKCDRRGKNHEIGGSAWYATGFITHYSKWHEAAGRPDTRKQLYDRFERKLGDRVNMKLVWRLFEANSDFVDWMIDTQDLAEDYSLENGAVFGAASLKQNTKCPWNGKRIDEMIGPGGSGWLITSKMEKYLREQETPILLKTAAKELILDEEGRIAGVLCEDEGGEVSICCQAVVIASGAFSRNKDIMNRMQPLFYQEGAEPVHIFTCATCTGDGIRMCENIGADIDYENRRVNMFGPKRHPYPAVTLEIGNGPMFNSEGQLYKEAPGMKEISDLAYDRKRYLWMIVDHQIAQTNMNRISSPDGTMTGISLAHFAKDWEKILQEEAADNSVVIADTLEELAEKLGYDAESFIRQIEAYNQALREPKPMEGTPAPMPDEMPDIGEVDASKLMEMMAGAKAQPIQKGPFYAVKQKLFHENAMGGINIDEDANVTKSGTKIPGLYAAGDTTRGIMVAGDIGVSYIEMVFSALTYAFNSGYLAGEEAAKYSTRKAN